MESGSSASRRLSHGRDDATGYAVVVVVVAAAVVVVAVVVVVVVVVDGDASPVLTSVLFELLAHDGADGLRVESPQLRLLPLLVNLHQQMHQELPLALLPLLLLLLLLLPPLFLLPLLLLLLQPEVALEEAVQQRLGRPRRRRRSSASQALVGGQASEIAVVVGLRLLVLLHGEARLSRRVHDVVDRRHHDAIAVWRHHHPG